MSIYNAFVCDKHKEKTKGFFEFHRGGWEEYAKELKLFLYHHSACQESICIVSDADKNNTKYYDYEDYQHEVPS